MPPEEALQGITTQVVQDIGDAGTGGQGESHGAEVDTLFVIPEREVLAGEGIPQRLFGEAGIAQ